MLLSHQGSPQGLLHASRLALCMTVAAALPTSARGVDGCLWDSIAPAPIARIEGPSVVVDDEVYVFGGFFNQALRATEQVHKYDPVLNTWTRLADMPETVTHAGFAVDGHTVWVVGGFRGNHPGPVVASVRKYDILSDSWSNGPALPAPRGSGGMARLGRELHYYGGVSTDKETDLGDHFVLDLDNPVGWTSAAPMPVPRNHFGSAELGGRAYAVGGQFRHEDDPEDITNVHAFDPVTGMWSEVASLPFGRSHTEPGTFVMGGRLIIVGGRANGIGNPALPDISAYDPVLDTWTALPPMPVGLVAPIANAYADRIFISSGGIGPVQPQVASFARAQSATLGATLRLNSGGGPFISPVALEEWCVDLGAMDGGSYTNSSLTQIAGTDNDELYLTERSGSSQHPTFFGYRIGVPDGLYRVRMHFSEIYWGTPGGGGGGVGSRLFDVTLEDQLVLDDYDIFADVGSATAVVHTFDVAVTDGAVDIDLHSSADRPKISGLEILRLDDFAFENYCIASPNSAGPGAHIGFLGNVSVGDNHFELTASGAPPGVSGLFLQGVSRPQVPLGSGFRCVGGSVFRLPPLVQVSPSGTATHALDMTMAPQPAGVILPGSSWNFQLWYRDGPTSNLSDGLGVQFTP